MKRSIFLKTFASYALLFLALSVLIFLLTIQVVRGEYQHQVGKSLGDLALSLRPSLAPLLAAGDKAGLERLVRSLGSEIDTRITVIDPRGRVLADSDGDPSRMENHGDRPEVRRALRGETAEVFHQSFTFGRSMLYHAVPLPWEGSVIGVLRVSVFSTMIDEVLAEVKSRIAFWWTALLGLALLVSLLFSRNLTRPIRAITRAAGQVAEGDFTARARVRGQGETRLLADRFNTMVDRQRQLVQSLEQGRMELQAVIAAIGDALLVLDREGRVVMANGSFERICHMKECQGRPYWEVLRDTRFHDLIKRSLESEAEVTSDVEIDDRLFLVRIGRVPAADRLIVTFHDVSEYRRLEKIKRDFISNLSHEMRTPLTAIRGFVETLEEGAEGESRTYLEIIRRHAERLAGIVSDLLTLSLLEEPRMRLERSEVDLAALAENVCRIFASRCREKGIRLSVNAAPGLPAFFGDAFKLEQLFINLVDNAVKYTDRGEVEIGLAQKDGLVEIRVRDTGVGIAAEHLPRIFERFYVADPARSREQGGTGLGLSIVKHIVLLHDGRIEVSSQPGIGTEFMVTLPIVRKI